MSEDDLFGRAREAADIERIAQVTLFRAGSRMRGECPLCGAGAGKRAGGPFSFNPENQRWNCFACGRPELESHGDLIGLEMLIGGGSLRDAAERLAGSAPAAPRADKPKREAARPQDDGWKARLAARLWREGQGAAGSPVETYLRARCLSGRVLERALACLRFHPEAYHSGRGEDAVMLPAMVGLVFAPAGATGGAHVTYLAPDGRSKTRREPAKRMWGPQGREGRWGGVWLSAPTDPGPLIVAEGIESALSAAVLAEEPCRVVAATSLDRLTGGLKRDRWGRLDPDMVEADPEKPAFTWPEAGPVLICIDRDMRPLRDVAMRRATGGTWRGEVDSETRSKIAAALARQQWLAAGASPVRTWAPGVGRDFNDELKEREGWAA